MTMLWFLLILAGDKPLTFEDVMKFRQISGSIISENGEWVAYSAKPDRGDGEGVVLTAQGKQEVRIPRGSRPQLTPDGAFAGFIQTPSALDNLKAEKDKKLKKTLKNAMVLVDTASGETTTFEKVKDFAFSRDSRFMARLLLEAEKKEKEAGEEKKETGAEETEESTEASEAEPATEAEEKEEKEQTEEEKKAAEKEKKRKEKEKQYIGKPLILRNLADGSETTLENVTYYAFDPQNRYLTYTVYNPDAKGNGLFRLTLADGEITPIHALDDHRYGDMVWHKDGVYMTFIKRYITGEEPEKTDPILVDSFAHYWDPAADTFTALPLPPEGWGVPFESSFTWTDDGARLFYQIKPKPPTLEEKEEEEVTEADLFDTDAILKKSKVDVWHTNDPLIKTHERKQYQNQRKRAYYAVYHLAENKVVPLADDDIRDVTITHNPRNVILSTNKPHMRAFTWAGNARDFYIADLNTGEKTTLVKALRSWADSPRLSPEGRYAVWFQDGHYHRYDADNKSIRTITQDMDAPFANEDHDYPSSPSGYGIAGWMENDTAVMIYDKYDIWVFPSDNSEPYRMTEGRKDQITYRIVGLDEDQRFIKAGETLLLEGYHERTKHDALYQATAGETGVEQLVNVPKRFNIIAKAKEADRILFTREDFREFPDLWTATKALGDTRKITNENPQIKDFAWGEPELVSWTGMSGKPLDGVLIKPHGYKEGDRVPVLVYYYRIFSNRLHLFNRMEVNHRPNFPYYTSNGYAVFLPDVKFDVERPGDSAVHSLVPGIHKIIDMGVAHPDKIGLHGHSWSGYQTAYVITQTDLFACAISGAPVSNMTSAYSGIRLGSGMARQFQYETGQSRIGHSMFERRDLYIDNSPVFYADRINTPTLIMFGDIDDAVPWEQGIEMYLAMRRLDKDVVFLQYRGEPHHLRKTPNKVDYSIKMKEYLDHYLKGEPAADWITQGEPYTGD